VEVSLDSAIDKKATLRFLKKAVRQYNLPNTVTIDMNGVNIAAIKALQNEPGQEIKMCQNNSNYLLTQSLQWLKFKD